MSYGNGISALYRFPAVNLGAGDTLSIPGPSGAEGRLISITSVVTTVHVGTLTTMTLGQTADPNAYATATIASAAPLDTFTRAFTRGVDDIIVADDDVELVVDSAATSGAADICVLIEWYGGDAS
jgi:hypothetical protein